MVRSLDSLKKSRLHDPTNQLKKYCQVSRFDPRNRDLTPEIPEIEI